MKKVLYIYGNLPAYREDFFTQLSSRLLEDDVELKVMYGYIANKLTRQAEAKAFKTQQFETKLVNIKLFRLSRLNGLLQAVINEKPDGVIFQFNQTNLSEWKVLKWCLKNDIPYGIWGCNYTRADLKGFLVGIRNLIYKYIYKHSSMCIPYGSKYHDFLVDVGVPEENVITAQNTINVEGIVEREKAYAHNRFKQKTTKILYVGALAAQKRIESSITAVSQLIQEGKDIRYDIVGGGSQLEVLQHQWDTLPAESKERIVLHGAKYGDDLLPFFREADVFLMPGTGGLGVNEAMAYGLPIISTEGDETIVDLIDGNGYLLNQMGDVEEQKNAICRFVDLSPEMKQQMSSNSVETILHRASLKNMVEKHRIACERMMSLK